MKKYYNATGLPLFASLISVVLKQLDRCKDIELINQNVSGDTFYHMNTEKVTLGVYNLDSPAAGIRGSFEITGTGSDIRNARQRLEEILKVKMVEA